MFLFSILTTILAATPTLAWLPGRDKCIHAIDGSNLFLNSSSSSFANGKRTPPTMTPVRGVNLGSMFVFEKFFAATSWVKQIGCDGCIAERDCVAHLGQAQANKVFQSHWSTWINQTDIQQMASYGLNTIRVPVGYWIFEDLVEKGETFPQGGLAYLEKICGWAADEGMYVIIDLHGAPGAQVANNSDTGQYIASPGFYVASQYTRAEKFLTYMTNLTHNGNTAWRSVGMLEVVNEPVRYATSNDTSMRRTYYPAAYNAIKAAESRLKVSSSDALNIQFMNKNWGSGDPNQYLTSQVSVAFDSHRYIGFSGVTPIHDSYINASCNYNVASDGDTPLIVGEFSMVVADSVSGDAAWSTTAQKAFYTQWFAAMATTFEKDAFGWIFWTWKTEFTTPDPYHWSYSAGVAAGVIPKNAADIGTSACDDYT